MVHRQAGAAPVHLDFRGRVVPEVTEAMVAETVLEVPGMVVEIRQLLVPMGEAAAVPAEATAAQVALLKMPGSTRHVISASSRNSANA